MAKPKGINQKARWSAHSIRLARYASRVQSVYDTLNKEIASVITRTSYDGSQPFRFADYPITKKKFEEVQAAFVRDLRSLIYSGTSEEWKQSNLVQDLLADKVLKFYGVKRNGKKHRVYYQTNNDALKAFQRRKDDGLNLSAKLWNQSKEYKTEMEYAISSAIEKGTSAVKLSKKLSKYLLDYPSLKHDYKEKFGKAVNCNDCEYRSIRLARSEINMAYRTAEQERWKQFDFVLGYEVKLTQNGGHVPDICDDLAGKYPKDFVFKGWHPNCMCYVIPILKTEEQFWNDEDVSEIVEPPKNFTDWLRANAERIDKAAENDTLPYWYTDNAKYVDTTRWENIRNLDEYDRRDFDRVQKWKEGLNLNTNNLEKLLRTKDVEDWRISGELMNLTSRIDREKDRFRDEWLKMYEKIESDDVQHGYDKGFIGKLRKQLSVVSSGLSYNVKMSWAQLQTISDMLTAYEKELVDVVVPSFSLKSAGFGTITRDVGRVRDQLNAFVGKAKRDHYGFLDFRDHFDHMATTGKMNDSIRQQFVEMLDRDEGAVWKCIDHLNEIANATNLDKIPRRWYRAFNKYMEEIRAFDIETNGYGGVYRQIEGAYNIYKLSTMPEVAKYGLSKVNDKMPWNLFEVFKEKGIDYRHLPSSSFFRYEGDFVPWYDGVRQNKKGNFSIYSDAYFSQSFQHVAINRAYFDQTYGRCAGKTYEVQNIFYHEYGHALDWQRSWNTKKKINDLFDKYAAKYEAMDADDLRGKLLKAMYVVNDKTEAFIKDSILDGNVSEQCSSVSDVIQAMRKDRLKVWGGHDDDYYVMKDHNGKMKLDANGNPIPYRYLQLTEFIAHMNESFWLYNDVWKAFDKDFYNEVKSIMRKAYRGGKDALN